MNTFSQSVGTSLHQCFTVSKYEFTPRGERYSLVGPVQGRTAAGQGMALAFLP